MSPLQFKEIPFTAEITPTGGLNKKAPPYAIAPNQCSENDGALSEGNYLESLRAPVTLAAVASGYTIDGQYIHESGVHIVMCAGNLYKYSGGSFAIVNDGAGVSTPGYRWSMAAYGNNVYMFNGHDQPLMYDVLSNTVKPLGLSTPKTYIKLGFFDNSETGQWSGGSEATASEWANVAEDGVTSVNPARSRKLTVATPGGTASATRSFSPAVSLNFPSGYGVTIYDFVEFYTYHTVAADLDPEAAITITLNDGTNDWQVTIPKLHLAADDFGEIRDTLPADNKVTHHRIPLYQFTCAAYPRGMVNVPSSISSITLTIKGDVNKTPTVYFDTIMITLAPPYATSLAKTIVEPWQFSAGNKELILERLDDLSSEGIGFKNYSGVASATVGGLDLTRWVADLSEYTSPDSDEIVLTVWRNNTGTLSTLSVRIGASAASYVSYNLLPQTRAGSKVQIRIQKNDSGWSGTPSWNNVNYFALQVSNSGDNYVVVSGFRMEPKMVTRDLTGTWGGGFQKWTSAPLPPGGNASYMLKVKGKGGTSGTLTFSSAVNFNEFSTGVPSDMFDEVVFWMYHTRRSNIKEVRIILTDSSNKEVYFSLAPSDLTGTKGADGSVTGDNRSGYYRIKKKNFIGTDFAWNSVTKITFTLQTSNTAKVYIADTSLENGGGTRGLYRWVVRYISDDFIVDSPTSIWTNGVVRTSPCPMIGMGGLLSNIRTPPDVSVRKIEIYRSTSSGTFALETVLFRNSTGQFPSVISVAMLGDEELGPPMEEDYSPKPGGDGSLSIPNGTKNIFNGSEHWVWGVGGYENYIFLATPFLPYAFNINRYLKFSSAVLDVIMLNNSAYVLTKSGIIKVAQGSAYLFEFSELPAGSGNVKTSGGGFFYVGSDANVYYFDGSFPIPVGDAVKSVFSQYDPSMFEAAFVNDLLYVFAHDSLGNHDMYVYNTRTKTWCKHGTSVKYKNPIVYKEKLYLGTVTTVGGYGYVHYIDMINGTSFENIDLTTAHVFGSDAERKRLDILSIWAVAGVGSPNLTVYIIKDGQPVGTGTTLTLNTYPKEHRIYLDGVEVFDRVAGMGSTFAIRLVHSGGSNGQCRILGLRLMGAVVTNLGE